MHFRWKSAILPVTSKKEEVKILIIRKQLHQSSKVKLSYKSKDFCPEIFINLDVSEFSFHLLFIFLSSSPFYSPRENISSSLALLDGEIFFAFSWITIRSSFFFFLFLKCINRKCKMKGEIRLNKRTEILEFWLKLLPQAPRPPNIVKIILNIQRTFPEYMIQTIISFLCCFGLFLTKNSQIQNKASQKNGAISLDINIYSSFNMVLIRTISWNWILNSEF